MCNSLSKRRRRSRTSTLLYLKKYCLLRLILYLPFVIYLYLASLSGCVSRPSSCDFAKQRVNLKKWNSKKKMSKKYAVPLILSVHLRYPEKSQLRSTLLQLINLIHISLQQLINQQVISFEIEFNCKLTCCAMINSTSLSSSISFFSWNLETSLTRILC